MPLKPIARAIQYAMEFRESSWTVSSGIVDEPYGHYAVSLSEAARIGVSKESETSALGDADRANLEMLVHLLICPGNWNDSEYWSRAVLGGT